MHCNYCKKAIGLFDDLYWDEKYVVLCFECFTKLHPKGVEKYKLGGRWVMPKWWTIPKL